MRPGLWKHGPGLFVSKTQRRGLFIELLDRFKIASSAERASPL